MDGMFQLTLPAAISQTWWYICACALRTVLHIKHCPALLQWEKNEWEWRGFHVTEHCIT